MKEDLKEDNWIGDVLEERIDGQLGAERGPVGPVGVGGAGAARSDSKGCRVLRSAPIIKERSLGGGVQRCQDRCCG